MVSHPKLEIKDSYQTFSDGNTPLDRIMFKLLYLIHYTYYTNVVLFGQKGHSNFSVNRSVNFTHCHLTIWTAGNAQWNNLQSGTVLGWIAWHLQRTNQPGFACIMFITAQLSAFNDPLNRPGQVCLIKFALITSTWYIFVVKGQFSIGSPFVYFFMKWKWPGSW